MAIVNQTLSKDSEAKHWESLYYKENALVGLLKQHIKALEEQVDYLKGKIAYVKKYEVNNENN